MLDVAPSRLRREADALGVDACSLRNVRTALAGLHDLRKFSRAFQAKAPELWPTAILGPWCAETDPGHWRLTASILAQERFLPYLRRLDLRKLIWRWGRPRVTVTGKLVS